MSIITERTWKEIQNYKLSKYKIPLRTQATVPRLNDTMTAVNTCISIIAFNIHGLCSPTDGGMGGPRNPPVCCLSETPLSVTHRCCPTVKGWTKCTNHMRPGNKQVSPSPYPTK